MFNVHNSRCEKPYMMFPMLANKHSEWSDISICQIQYHFYERTVFKTLKTKEQVYLE